MKTSVDENVSGRLALGLAGASTIAIMFSIAVAQILLGAGIGVLLFRRNLWRAPPILLPITLLFLWTFVAKVHAQGLFSPSGQLRKFFVYLIFFLVFAAVRQAIEARWILLGICAIGTLSASWSFVQFTRRVLEAQRAGVPFYDHYQGQRTTGFMSHWMTFSGEMLVVFAIAIAFLLFARAEPRETIAASVMSVLAGAAIVLNQTRGAWLAAAAACAYLVAVWRPRWLIALPVLAVGIFVVSPESVQQRAVSLYRPRGTVDSNLHRYITWRTGLAMIEAHPWLGLGPERVETRFHEFVPPDIRRPLPTGWYGHLHNVYLQIAAERGIPGLVFLLWLLGRFVWDWVSGLRLLPAGRSDERFVLQAAMAVLIGTMFGGIFEYNLGNSELLHLFLAVAACGYVAYAMSASSRRVASHPLTH